MSNRLRTDLDLRNGRIEYVLKHIEVKEILDAYGFELMQPPRSSQKGGYEFDGACPFHDTITMNFSIHSDSGRWFCRSSVCGLVGDIFSFVQKHEGCGEVEAYQHLCQMAGIEPVSINPLTLTLGSLSSIGSPSEKSSASTKPKVMVLPQDYEVLAHPYMTKVRGIEPQVLLDAKAGYIRDQEFYCYRAAVPLYLKGKLYSVYSRATIGEQKWLEINPTKDSSDLGRLFPKHHYRGETLTSYLLYGFDEVLALQTNTVILVEAIISVLKLRSLGIENAVAMLKATLSEAQIRLLANRFETILILNDNDVKVDKDTGKKFNPGMKAAWTNYHRLKEFSNVGILTPPPNVDPAEFETRSDFTAIASKVFWPQTRVKTLNDMKEFLS